MTYAFRLRFDLPPGLGLAGDSTEITVLGDEQELPRISLTAVGEVESLQESRTLALFGHGYGSHYDAHEAGIFWMRKLKGALAGLSVGADFGERSPEPGGFNPTALSPIARSLGVQLEDDRKGLLVYEDNDVAVSFLGGSARAAVFSPVQSLINYRLFTIEGVVGV